MATLILKKPTAGDFFISDVGIIIPGLGQDTFTEAELIRRLATSDNTRSAVTGGTLIVNDGSSDLSAAAGIEYLEQLWVQAGYTVTGPVGSQGAQGFQGVGSQGLQGNQGNQGISGAGVQGSQGSQGPQGNQGFQGPSQAGTQGPQGNQGFQGSQGLQGIVGAGVQGPQGNQGGEGLQGNQGFQGAIGAGVQGPQGNEGTQGQQGPQGNQGFQGLSQAGVQGFQGNQGFQGAARPKYLFGNTAAVPAGGTLQMNGPGNAIQGYRMMRAGTITGGSIQVNTADASRAYNLDIRVNAVSVATVPLPVSTLGASNVVLSVPVVVGDVVSAFLVRTSGAGASTFDEMASAVEVTES